MLKRLFFSPIKLLWHFCWHLIDHKYNGLFMNSVLLHLSICLSLCQYLYCLFKIICIEVWLICKDLYIFKVYNSISLGISIHLWNHHCYQSHKHVYYLLKFPPTPFLLLLLLLLLLFFLLLLCSKNTQCKIYSLNKFQVYHTILLAVGIMLLQ